LADVLSYLFLRDALVGERVFGVVFHHFAGLHIDTYIICLAWHGVNA
jgi:hypothetical protein